MDAVERESSAALLEHVGEIDAPRSKDGSTVDDVRGGHECLPAAWPMQTCMHARRCHMVSTVCAALDDRIQFDR